MNQTVAECLTAATDSVTLITDINTNGLRSVYVGGTADTDTDMSQDDINEVVQRNVDHLEVILATMVKMILQMLQVLVMINHLTLVQ